MAIDPICGMTVEEASALRAERDGQTFHFCGEHCRQKFLSTPAIAEQDEQSQDRAIYTCPMHPEVRQEHPGHCPKCGMALEPIEPAPPVRRKIKYTCPMHPQIVRDAPRPCPICGMALEPMTVTQGDLEGNAELRDMTRRFWVSLVLTIPLLIVAMGRHIPGIPLESWFSPRLLTWIELVLATPVVLWGGWLFFQRAWTSVITWHLNMFTLISLGVAVAWTYSVVATLAPAPFPPPFVMPTGKWACITRPPPSSSHSSCWGRCWNCAPAARPAALSRRC